MLEDIWREYFVKPALDPAQQGYNPVNTLVYVGILLAVSFWLIYPQLNKRGIKFDARFAAAVLPYIVLGSALRVLEDMKLVPRSVSPLEWGYYTYTPGIYIAVGVLTILALFAAKWLSNIKGIDFYKAFAGIGLVLAFPVVAFDFSRFIAWDAFLLVFLLLALVVVAVVFLYERFVQQGFFRDRLNLLALAGQGTDGLSTLVATYFQSCGEQHVLSRLLIGAAGPIAFPAVKIALILAILYYVDKEVEEQNLRNFIKLFIMILGFAPGLRNAFTVGVGTCL